MIFCFVFFFNDTATTEIYTLSLHDALPILELNWLRVRRRGLGTMDRLGGRLLFLPAWPGPPSVAPFGVGLEDRLVEVLVVASQVRSEEHTSELQSPMYLVCRLLLEKKKQKNNQIWGNLAS